MNQCMKIVISVQTSLIFNNSLVIYIEISLSLSFVIKWFYNQLSVFIYTYCMTKFPIKSENCVHIELYRVIKTELRR